MSVDEKYMQRCLQLASNGKGSVSPNPMVGAVVVHNNKIIGEGYHRQYGQAHAEVNAINAVQNKNLLQESTIYVSLEPCSHYGKTPPCAQLLIDSKIKKVVIACLDPFPSVAGRGVKMLQDAGIEIEVGVLEEEAKKLNKEFITAQLKNRPYIYLKWAQSHDGYIDKKRESLEDALPSVISSSFTKLFVHKCRTEIDAILVGTNTAVKDNPSLTSRLWSGKNPTRIILDKNGRIPFDYNIFDNEVQTIIFTERKENIKAKGKNVQVEVHSFDKNSLSKLLEKLKELKINAILVEGGSLLLQDFINQSLWDEALVEISASNFEDGVKAPNIEGKEIERANWGSSEQIYLVNY